MKSAGQKRSRPLVFAILGLACGLFFWFIATGTPVQLLFESFEARTYDQRAKLTSLAEDHVIDDVIIIDIDARSIHKLGRFNRWSRELYAKLLDVLDEGGAAAVAFDILFDPDQDISADSFFLDAIIENGRVGLALDFSLSDSNNFLYPMDAPPDGFIKEGRTIRPVQLPKKLWSRDRLEPGVNEFYNNAAFLGFVNSRSDPDGVVRRAPPVLEFAGEIYPSFPFALAAPLMGWDLSTLILSDDELVVNSFEDEEFRIPLDGDGNLLLHYRGPFQTFRYISFYEVVEERIPPAYFENKVVFIGTSFAGLSDLVPTPVESETFPGVEVHATVFHNLVYGNPMLQASRYVTLAIILFLAVFAAISVGTMRVSWAIGSIIAVELIYLITTFYMFDVHHLVMQIITPTGVLVLTAIVSMSYKYLVEEREKKWVRRAFGHYVSADVVNELMTDPKRLSLGGVNRELTLMFTDIRDFTSLSEGLSAEQLGTMLNRYLTVMTDIVMIEGGTLDKYIGDALVAFFGAPLPTEDHSQRALRAALRMQRAIVELRKEFEGTGFASLRVGVGINTGPVMVGNFGSTQRFDYTAIGDSMNLASRLEGLTKLYRCDILTTAETIKHSGGDFVTRVVDTVRVKGKNEPVDLIQVYGMEDDYEFPNGFIDGYEMALDKYKRGEFEEAKELFEAQIRVFPEDGAAYPMMQRCERLITNPMPDWDGIWKMMRK